MLRVHFMNKNSDKIHKFHSKDENLRIVQLLFHDHCTVYIVYLNAALSLRLAELYGPLRNRVSNSFIRRSAEISKDPILTLGLLKVNH